MRTVIGQTKKNEDAEESDKNRGRVEPYYITCMTITILGAVLAVVSNRKAWAATWVEYYIQNTSGYSKIIF